MGRIIGRGYLQTRAPATHGGAYPKGPAEPSLVSGPLLAFWRGSEALGPAGDAGRVPGQQACCWCSGWGEIRVGWMGPTGRQGLGWAPGWALGCQPGCRAGSRWVRYCGRLGVGAVLGGSQGGGVRAW